MGMVDDLGEEAFQQQQQVSIFRQNVQFFNNKNPQKRLSRQMFICFSF
jgi:hypothetical protein